MASETYNPYCLVLYLYWEVTGKILYCKDCVMDCEFKKVRAK